MIDPKLKLIVSGKAWVNIGVIVKENYPRWFITAVVVFWMKGSKESKLG